MVAKALKPNQLISYEQLLEFIEQRGPLDQPFTTKSVALHFGISIYKTRYCLGILHLQGLIKRSKPHQGQKIRWMLP